MTPTVKDAAYYKEDFTYEAKKLITNLQVLILYCQDGRGLQTTDITSLAAAQGTVLAALTRAHLKQDT